MSAEPNSAITSTNRKGNPLENAVIVNNSDHRETPVLYNNNTNKDHGFTAGATATSGTTGVLENHRMLLTLEESPTNTAMRKNRRRGTMRKKPIAAAEITNTTTTTTTTTTIYERVDEDSSSSNSHCSRSSSNHAPERSTSTSQSRRRKTHTATGTVNSEESPTVEYDPPFITSNGILDVAAVSLNSHLLCSLCCGYYREPYTITECFHTFCKSCIFTTFHLKYLKCPVCKISLEPDPYKVVISDRTMQELVLKLFPQLQQLDEEQERLFYESRGIQRKKLKKLEGAHHHELHQQQQQQQQPRTNISRRSKWNSSNHGINTSFQNHKRPNTYLSSLSQEETNLNNTPLTMQQSNRNSSSSSKYHLSNEKALLVDEILFLLLPHKYQEGYRHLPPLRNQVIRTSGRLKIRLLRKYIYNNLIALDQSLSEINPSLVEILCCGDPLGDELSITFVHKTRWVLSTQFSLTYRILEELDG